MLCGQFLCAKIENLGFRAGTSYELLKVNLLVSQAERFHVDTLDLYSACLRAGFIKQASIELGIEEKVIKGDLGKASVGWVKPTNTNQIARYLQSEVVQFVSWLI